MSGRLHQIHTAFSCSLGTFLLGLYYVWPSYTLDLFKSENSTVLTSQMTDFECSLVGSLPSLGAMVGSALVGSIIDGIGRSKGGFVFTLPFVISWIIVKLTTSTKLILLARFIGGLSAGAFLILPLIFISEISEDTIRGALTTGPTFLYCIGVLLSYMMGWMTTYHTTVWISLTISVTCALLFLTVTESPLYLMRENKQEEARAAIALYRGTSVDSKLVIEEFTRLKQKVQPTVAELLPSNGTERLSNIECRNGKEMSAFKLLFISATSRRAFFVVASHLSLLVWMGIVPVQIYAKDLFYAAAPDISSHLCSVLLAMVMVAGSLFSLVFADRAGRRILIISSSLLVAVCIICLGVLISTNIAPPILSAVLLLTYCFVFNIGAGTVPYVLMSEMFVPEVQNVASMICIEWAWLTNSVVIGVFPYIISLVQFQGACFIFALFSFLNASIAYFMLPETRGLSNDQIQDALMKLINK